LLLADEREETLVVFVARGASLRVRAHSRHALSEEANEETLLVGVVGVAHDGVASLSASSPRAVSTLRKRKLRRR
jgi:hypothetical protein